MDLQPYPYPDYEPKLWGALGYIAGRAMTIAEELGFEVGGVVTGTGTGT